MAEQNVSNLDRPDDDAASDDSTQSFGPEHEMPPVAVDESKTFVREALRLREANGLDEAIAHLRTRDPGDTFATTIYFKMLYERQAYAELQEAVLAAVQSADLIPAKVSSEYLLILLRYAQRVCLPTETLEALANDTALPARQDPEVVQTWRALRHRLLFRRYIAEKYSGEAAIISIGLHCLPWHLPALWGFRDATRYRTQFNPFALAGHRLPGVIDALHGDFSEYCTTESVRIVETGNGHMVPMRKDRGAVWNHNRGTYWTASDLKELQANMRDKIAAFRESCRDPNAVFLISKVEHEFPDEKIDFLADLNAGLARFTGTDRNRIIISNQTAEDRPAKLYSVDETTQFFYCPYPNATYVWHDDDTEDSAEGLLYERRYAFLLASALARLGVFQQAPVAAEVAPE